MIALMKVLFITASRIGDAVFTTGLLDYIARVHKDAKVTIVCGPLVESLFEGYPNLERIIPLKKQKRKKHWIDLWKQVVGTRWDMVVDMRNSAVSRLIRANERHIYGSHIDKRLHIVAQNAAVMGLGVVPDTHLWFTDAQMEKARGIIGDGGPVAAFGPASNWLAKTWPVERFIEIAQWMTAKGGVMEGARVAVIAAPGEEDIAYEMLENVPEDRRIDVIAKGTPGDAAAVLSLCDFYMGNDSGLLHSAAATGIKTLGLYGPSWPDIYSPWGEQADHVRTPESSDELRDYPGFDTETAPCLMESLDVERVKAKIIEMFA